MRTLLPMQEEQKNLTAQPTLRIDKPAAAYARRSDHKARDKERDKSQSREMQTEDMIAWAMKQGWKKQDLFEFFADLGLSGTLRPDQRPDMLRLFDEIDSGKFDHGTVICWQENRLFRDETQIYYNQFIQKCLEHDILVVVISPHLMIYDFRDDFYQEMFRWKQKESADFIKRHVKGWMIPAKFRAAWYKGEWAGWGDLPPGFIVDYNEDNPTYKKPIPYWPHIEKINEYFTLFVELGCDIGLMYERLRKTPIIFPEFEAWVDPRNVRKCKMSNYPGGGYYIKGKSSIVSMLTNPFYAGYRVINNVIRRNAKGEKIRDHDGVIDREIFDLCYFSLAKTDLDGNPINGRSQKRYYQQGNDAAYGLLKFRVISNQGRVRVHPFGKYKGKANEGAYFIEYLEQEVGLEHYICIAAIPCLEIDTLVVDRLMTHVQTLSKNQEDIQAYEENAERLRLERQRKIKQIQDTIKDIHKEQAGLARSLGKVEVEIEEAQEKGDLETADIKQRRKELIEEQIDTLERERRTLIDAKAQLEEEATNDLGSLDDQLRNLETQWQERDFEKRRSLLNFLIKEVVIDMVSTHWVRVQVLWLHEEWGREEIYYHRDIGSRREWTEEEEAILKQHYATMHREPLQELLPDRTWESIRYYASTTLGIVRDRKDAGRPGRRPEHVYPDRNTSYSDLQFMREKGIPLSARYTRWEGLLVV